MTSYSANETGRAAVSKVVALAWSHTWIVSVWAAMLGWTVALALIVRDRYLDFRFVRYDLGNMVQAVWSTAQGRPLEWTNGFTGEQAVRLGTHVDPILAALTPLWIVAPSPITLAVVQVVAVGLGTIPVFWLARRHMRSDRAAGLLALAYLADPWIAWTAVDAFHPVTLAIPLFLFCVWFLDTDRLLLFALCAVLALCTGELMGVVVAALGIWYAIARRERWIGAAVAVVGAAWTLVAVYVVVPAFSGGESVYYDVFADVGGSPLGLLRTAVTDPLRVVAAATSADDLLYLAFLAAPLALTFLLAPGLAAVALPQLAVNLLASVRATTDPHAHYVAGVLPFLFAAAAIGLGRLSFERRVRAAGVALALSLAATLAVGPWPGTLLGAAGWGPLSAAPEHVQVLRRAVDLVPDQAAVSATNRVGSHLAARRHFHSVPVLGNAEWIVLESADTWIPEAAGGRADPEALVQFRHRIERSPEWRRLSSEGGVYVFRKVER